MRQWPDNRLVTGLSTRLKAKSRVQRAPLKLNSMLYTEAVDRLQALGAELHTAPGQPRRKFELAQMLERSL
jgi:hypothetical protein